MPTRNCRVSVLDDIGDPDAPLGSIAWAKWMLGQAQLCRQDMQRQATGLQSIIKKLEKHEGWKALGFASLNLLCHATLDLDDEQVQAIREARRGVTIGQVLARAKNVEPLAEHGNQEGQNNSRNRVDNIKSVQGGTSAEYLVRRLKRDRPDIAVALGRGEYSSARAAAIAAGIVKVPTPLQEAKKLVAKMNATERRQLARWLDEQQ